MQQRAADVTRALGEPAWREKTENVSYYCRCIPQRLGGGSSAMISWAVGSGDLRGPARTTR